MDKKMGEKSENKKKKKKKTIIIAVAVVLVVILAVVGVIVGVNAFKGGDDFDDFEYVESTTNAYQKEMTIEQGPDDKVDVDTTPIGVSLSDSGLKKIEKAVDSVDVDYDFSELYNLSYADKKIGTMKNSVKKHSHDIRVNGQFDGEHFYKLVKANNKAFLKKQKADDKEDMYQQYTDEQLKKICNDMMIAISDIAGKGDYFDDDMVACYLYDLVIMKSSYESANELAAFTMDNRFYLNDENITRVQEDFGDVDVMKVTLYHEYMHAFQLGCNDIENKDCYRIGMSEDSYTFIDPNPVMWFWLLEGSAEMNMSQILDKPYFTYATFTSYLESIDYVNSVGEGDWSRAERLSFQHDINKIFDIFGAKTDDEKKEIIKMMYSIEIMQKEPMGFDIAYNNKYNTEIENDENGERCYVKLNVKEDILLTLTKYYYRNLARQINSGKVTLQDVYYLTRLWEANLVRHTSSDFAIRYMEFFHNFYDEYIDIQNDFFKVLCEENGLDFDKTIDDFESYSINATKKSPNCDLEFFNADGKKFMNKFMETHYVKGFSSIRECKKKSAEYDEQYPIDELMNHREYLVDLE